MQEKMKKRGSTKPIDEKVTPLPHKPAKGDPPVSIQYTDMT